MDYIFFKESSEDWSYIWDSLREHPINEGLEEPCVAKHEDKEWQYVGSFRNGNNIITQFYHHNHPNINSPYRYTLQHELISEDSIGKSSRIK